jgi:hypothetical protein
MERWGGEEHCRLLSLPATRVYACLTDIWACIVSSGTARIASRLGTWYSGLDSDSIAYEQVKRTRHTRYRLLTDFPLGHPFTYLDHFAGRFVARSALERDFGKDKQELWLEPTSSVTTIESPILPCCQKCTSLLEVV